MSSEQTFVKMTDDQRIHNENVIYHGNHIFCVGQAHAKALADTVASKTRREGYKTSVMDSLFSPVFL